jgi:hypothetical protein
MQPVASTTRSASLVRTLTHHSLRHARASSYHHHIALMTIITHISPETSSASYIFLYIYFLDEDRAHNTLQPPVTSISRKAFRRRHIILALIQATSVSLALSFTSRSGPGRCYLFLCLFSSATKLFWNMQACVLTILLFTACIQDDENREGVLMALQ